MTAAKLIKEATGHLSDAATCAEMDKPALSRGHIELAIETLQAALAELKAKQAKP